MKLLSLHDRGEIEAFLRGNTFLHIYSIGDLDDFFWPYTTWYAIKEAGEIQALVLLYTGGDTPTLLALTDDARAESMRELLRCLLPALPRAFYAHFTPGLEAVVREAYSLAPHGSHYKMALNHPARIADVDVSEADGLSVADADDIRELLEAAYPGNWFEPRMLETGMYFGIRASNRLVSMAGVHVYSARYRVAALGNIATHPDFRGKGYARTVTARACAALLDSADHIGLNVHVDNQSAIRCYERLGFETIATYGEFDVGPVGPVGHN